MAAGADLSKIISWKGRNLSTLEKHIREWQPRLVVISPLNTYLPKINTWNDKEVRDILQPIADIASEHGTAILGIMHPPKSKQSVPIHSVVGSIGFGALARSVMVTDRQANGTCLVEGIKQNLAKKSAPLAYRIVSWSDNPDIGQLKWEAVINPISFTDADENSALAEACEFINMVLGNSNRIPTTTLKIAAEKNGLSLASIKRARKVLNVQAERISNGKDSCWMLSLPVPELIKTSYEAPSK